MITARRTFHSIPAATNDNRQFVLLLRSFTDDMMAIPHSFLEKLNTVRFTLSICKIYRRLFEETLAIYCKQYGPIMAAADPHDDLPTLGSIKFRMSENWRDLILERFRESQRIILIVNDSPSTAYEIQKVFELGMLAKVIFVFPPTGPFDSRLRWLFFRELVRTTTQCMLPENIPEKSLCFTATAQDYQVRFFGSRGYNKSAYASALSEAWKNHVQYINSIRAFRSYLSATVAFVGYHIYSHIFMSEYYCFNIIY
ncbi:Uncharacterized protein OS=Amycolatopsis rifamycinica GN=DV20_09155 PE=4 SV=1 [Gemmata massiliana]|uniref:Uncharacterized protein n=1 Tax=Gemmata massiliana TaxID=1210884 RepID=A0A6P2CPW3_9BACT|nr:hypothetical protein [Gemmata massiliana]VTR90943.1 Uncharacterized protein OS=Amycolatopsis rifamycinica GN=DV20_09155 PE=4 SV=1 [Gemmata massiliana]